MTSSVETSQMALQANAERLMGRQAARLDTQRDLVTAQQTEIELLTARVANIDGVWNDRNSKRLLKWICQAEAFEAKVISTGNRDGVGEEFRALLEKLTRILSNPLKPFLLDNPLAEGDFLWGETLLTRIQARTEVSLYTGRAFEVRPHEPLRAIRSWAERFFPNLFTHVMPPNEQEPLSAEELEVLRKSACLVVKLNEEHNAHQADKARLANQRQAARTTGLEMIRQMEGAYAHGERQLDGGGLCAWGASVRWRGPMRMGSVS